MIYLDYNCISVFPQTYQLDCKIICIAKEDQVSYPLVDNGILELVDNVKRGRGRPKLTWDESVKRDLKDWNISKEIALDRSAWRLAINVPEP